MWSKAEKDAAAVAKVDAVTVELGNVLGVNEEVVVGTLLSVDGTLTYGATRHGSSGVVIGVPTVLLWFDIKIPIKISKWEHLTSITLNRRLRYFQLN